MTRRAKQGYFTVFTPPNGCNGFCFALGGNRPYMSSPHSGDSFTALCLLHELGFQLHRPNPVDLAVDIVIAFDQPDIFDLGADLNHR